jgi:hypothetical protein
MLVTNTVTMHLTLVPNCVTRTEVALTGAPHFVLCFLPFLGDREFGRCVAAANDRIIGNTRSREIRMGYVGRHFCLSSERGNGVFCDENGLLVGGVPLLERIRTSGRPAQWRPRPILDLNRDLSKRYGLPVEITPKMRSLAAIARAFDRGDLVHALVAAPHQQRQNLHRLSVKSFIWRAT